MASFFLEPPIVPFQLLEINIISAQDLAPVTRSMRSYATVWVHPSRKLSTRVDSIGYTDPTWNDKFVFRVDDTFLRSDSSAVNIQISSRRCFSDANVGTVRVLINNLLPSHLQQQPAPSIFSATSTSSRPLSFPTRFVALQVRRPSGRPQGIINIGVALLDASMRSMPLYSQLSTSAVAYRDLMGNPTQDPKTPQDPTQTLRRSKSEYQHIKFDDYPTKPAPTVMEGSEVTAEFYPAEIGSSVLEDWSVASEGAGAEDLRAKLDRWRTEMSPIYDQEFGSFRTASIGHSRRKTDGGGLFGCFGDSFGCECSISCGRGPKSKKKGAGKIHNSPSDGNLSRLYNAHHPLEVEGLGK